MITKFDLKLLNHGELINFFTNLKKITSKNPILTLTVINELLSELLEEMTSVYNKERGSRYTEDLREADQKRDLFFVAIVTILEQHRLTHPEPAMRETADQLLAVMLKHGKNLHRKNYVEETAGLNEISSTVDKNEDLFDLFTQLHLDGYFTALKNANIAFDDIFMHRNDEAAQRIESTVTLLRPKVEETFKKLASRINSFIDINEDNPTAAAPYVQLAAEINALLDTYLGGKSRNRRDEATESNTNTAPETEQ